MKRTLCLILALMLVTLCLPTALSEARDVSAVGDDYSVYIGKNNRLYEPGETEPVWDEAVRAVVAIDGSEVFFTTADPDTLEHDRDSVLWALDLAADADPREIAHISHAAIYRAADGVIYYVGHDDLQTLCACDAATGDTTALAQAPGEILGLRDNLQGLIVATGSDEWVYQSVTRAFERPARPVQGATTVPLGGTAELVLTAQGALELATSASVEPTAIDESVQCADAYEGVAYYLKKADGHSELYAYDPATGTKTLLYTFMTEMLNELTVDGQFAYTIDEYAFIYRVDVKTLAPDLLSVLNRDVVYAPELLAFSGYLLVYDRADDSDETFVEFVDIESAHAQNMDELASLEPAAAPEEVAPAPVYEDEDVAFEEVEGEAVETPEPEMTPVPAPVAASTPKAAATPKPTPKRETEADFTNLTRGARGDAVERLQLKLRALGYLSGSADGVYGAATHDAVKLLQSDMGYTATGNAGPKFQYAVYHGNPPRYERYRPLQKGDSGARVVELQERLRALYYTVSAANGEYKAGTVDAVKRFQREMGYKANGKISATQLKKLFQKHAPQYSRYLDLNRGDSAPAVKRLCNRLKKLNYFSGKVTSSYGSSMVKAVKLFQSNNGIYATGVADENLQLMIFDSGAKPYQPEPTPAPTPKPEQMITNKQVKAIRNWMNKHLNKDYSNKQAVKRLQDKLRNLGYMDGKSTKIYDENTLRGCTRYQMAMGLGSSGYADSDTLKSLFK